MYLRLKVGIIYILGALSIEMHWGLYQNLGLACEGFSPEGEALIWPLPASLCSVGISIGDPSCVYMLYTGYMTVPGRSMDPKGQVSLVRGTRKDHQTHEPTLYAGSLTVSSCQI